MPYSSRTSLIGAAWAALATLSGCSDSTDSSTPLPDISGRWKLAVGLRQETCAGDASVDLAQDGDRFVARISNSSMLCHRGMLPLDSTLHGEINGNKILASGQICVLVGNIAESVPDYLDGDISCVFHFPYTTLRDRGHWWLTRPSERPNTADLTGEWVMVGNIGYRPQFDLYVCGVNGIFRMVQMADSATGQFSYSTISCLLPYPTNIFSGLTAVVKGDTFTLSTGRCTYTGTVAAGSLPVRMSGDFACRVSSLFGGEYTFTGPGQMARLSAFVEMTD